jgi:uncharacterized Zn finger protein (UPF0148 family)
MSRAEHERFTSLGRSRLPLQVGTTALWSLARASLALYFALLLILAAFVDLRSERVQFVFGFGLFDFGTLGICGLLAAHAGLNLRRALRKRPSDLLLSPAGWRIHGGRLSTRLSGWNELSTPFAEVEKRTIRELNLSKILLFLPLAILAPGTITSFRASVEIVSLWIYRGGQRLLGARSDRPLEVQSMRAAASSIRAVADGRRHVNTGRNIAQQVVVCPTCGAPVVPDDAEKVPCGRCGVLVPLPRQVRDQAAAAKEMAEGRSLKELLQRLFEQPSAAMTNVWLHLLAGTLFLTATWSLVLFLLMQRWNVSASSWLEASWTILGVPFLVCASLHVIGMRMLARRSALQVLSLGYGALAPEKSGQPSSCRRCAAPLLESRARGVMRCVYCGADNILGIDLRPFVDATRRERASLDEFVTQQQNRRRRWAWASALAVIALVSAIGVLGSLSRMLSTVEETREVACMTGDAEACDWSFERRRARGESEEASSFPYDKACSEGHAQVCYTLGERLRTGTGMLEDLPRAASHHGRACALGHGPACFRLGVAHATGAGVPVDAVQAETFLARACDDSIAEACNRLGTMVSRGRGLPQDHESAVARYTRGCDLGSMSACRNLAFKYTRGEGVVEDQSRAAAFHERACEGGLLSSCHELAYRYAHGNGVDANGQLARRLFRRNCAAGYRPSCKEGWDDELRWDPLPFTRR